MAKNLFKSTHGAEFENILAVIGTDGTGSMTGKYNECLRGLEELLNKPLQSRA